MLFKLGILLAWRRLLKRAAAAERTLWVCMDFVEEPIFMRPIEVGWFLVTFAVMDDDDETSAWSVSTSPIWTINIVQHTSLERQRAAFERAYEGDEEEEGDDDEAADDEDDAQKEGPEPV